MNSRKVCIAILCWKGYKKRLARTISTFWKFNGHGWDDDIIIWDNTDTGEDRSYIDKLPFRVFREGNSGVNLGVQDGTIRLWEICVDLGYNYILNLQDDFPSLAKTNIKTVISFLESRPKIGYVRLNKKRYSKKNMITGKTIKKERVKHKKAKFFISNMHFTLNPAIFRKDLLPLMKGCKSEIEMMKSYQTKYKLQAQLLPPTFKTVIVKRRSNWKRHV